MEGAFEGVEAFDVVVELDLADVAGVAGGDGLGLGGGVADVSSPEVFDFVGVDFFAFDLFDEPGFGFDFLPHHGVVGAFGDVVEDLDGGVLVALPDDAALALLEIGWAPGHIDVMQGRGAGLHVGAGPHLFRRAHQNGHLAGGALAEQFELVGRLEGVVDETYRFGRHSAFDEFVADGGVDGELVRVGGGGAAVTEHDLQAAVDRHFHAAVGVAVGVLAVGVVDPQDLGGYDGGAAAGRRLAVGQ